MQKLLITSAVVAITALAASKAMAQSDPPPAETPNIQQGITADGLIRQAALPPMELLRAIFLDIDASRAAGEPMERGNTTFVIGEQITIYTKFANVGRTNPGAVDGFMQMTTHLRVDNSAGQTIIDQSVAEPPYNPVPYFYVGDIPDAYFDSFKLTIVALQTPDTYTFTLSFVDETRPTTDTAPVVVTLVATVQ